MRNQLFRYVKIALAAGGLAGVPVPSAFSSAEFTFADITTTSLVVSVQGEGDPFPPFPMGPVSPAISSNYWTFRPRTWVVNGSVYWGFVFSNFTPGAPPLLYSEPLVERFVVTPGVATNYPLSLTRTEPVDPAWGIIYELTGQMSYSGSGTVSWTVDTTAHLVPEPGTWALLALGAGGLAAGWRRRRR